MAIALRVLIVYRVTKFTDAGICRQAQDIDGPTAMALQFINRKNGQGLTPLQLALSYKKQHVRNALTLVLNGADPNVRYGLSGFFELALSVLIIIG